MRVVNKVSSSAPVKRGKEREKPKVKKPTNIRKVFVFLADVDAGRL
jgi:hypothetical protein